ncbi:MAG: AAA family ATPase [Verrucomicrobiota bacterium]
MTQETGKVKWDRVQNRVGKLREAIGTVVIGQETIVEQMLVALICRGHCLIVGVPGLAKTLLVSTLGTILGLSFRRIQFTPDLMPMDILGSEILQGNDGGGERAFKFVRGPIFANLILADEINRTPPKTQAALLEAMQEKQVTVAGQTWQLEAPFLVYATQNPIEHEGTYPLPEAQLDRFFAMLKIDYPSLDQEREIVTKTSGGDLPAPEPVLNREDVLELQEACAEIPLPDNALEAILKLVHSSRPSAELSGDFVRKYVEWGAGPRGAQNLARAARALAMLRGNSAASIEEVRELAAPVLRHRIIPNYNATGEGVSVEDIITHLLEKL